MMTLTEFKADLERETMEPGEKLSMAAAKILYSQYREHEAEAVAGGRDEVISLDLNDYVHHHDAHDPNFDLDTHDLDSTGHVYMASPEQQEAEIEFMSRYDAVNERFAGTEETGDDWHYIPDAEEIAEMEAQQLAIDSTPGAHSTWFPWMNKSCNDQLDDPSAANYVPF